MSDPERNKRRLREQREASQRAALPSGLPEAGPFERATPLVGLSPTSLMIAVDAPGDNIEELIAQAQGFPSQAMGPTFLSYGPMLADGDVVVEEWESFIFGRDGTLYNNQYCWVLTFDDDGGLVAAREYNDSHHAWLIFSQHGGWPELEPPTSPRRQHRAMGPHASEELPASEIETGFEVIDEFELDPRMLADVVPVATAPPAPVDDVDGNKALVRGLRHARAGGDPAVVGRFFAEGFRHFIAGERPFGWDHLPLAEIYAPLVEHLASPVTVRFGPLSADGDRVFEEMDILAHLDDGTVYNNWHCFVHEIRDGKIVQTREYLDTRHVWVVLGRWAEWAATPVAPRTEPRRSNLQSIASTIQIPTMFLELDRWQPFES